MLLVIAGCGGGPSYPPPAQRSLLLEPWEADPPFVDMRDPEAGRFIVKDISDYPGAWRWTAERPELRFALNCTTGQKFVAEFSVAADTLARTGPLTIAFFIDDRLLGSSRYTVHGRYRFEKDVPAGWLSTTEYTRVVMQPDKIFVAEGDGAKLGFLLGRAGFVGSCGRVSAF
jgi:hypothetical protein